MSGVDPVHRVNVPTALDAPGVESLARDIDAAQRAESCRVIVLQAEGPVFCRGLSFETLFEKGGSVSTDDILPFAECLWRLWSSDRPVVAAVSGDAFGGGVGLVAASHMVIAGSTVRVGLPELAFGLLPAVIWPFLLERMSPARASLWAMDAESRDAEDARQAGLVDVVVPPDQIASTVRRASARLRRTVPGAVAFRDHRTAGRESVRQAAREGARTTARLLNDEDVRRRLKAYLQDGQAPWRVPE